MAEVFISYARVNQGFVRDLNHALQKSKRDTWIDWRSIPDSAEWRAEIFAAIDAADNFLFIISPDSLRSEMCKLEVAHAFASKKRVTTILYHPVDWNELLPGLAEIQWINYPELGFEETFRRLIAALDTDLEWVRQHTRLAEKARDWANKRNESFLLRGMALQDALKWLAQSTVVNEPKLLPLQEEYIRASQKWEAGEIERLKELSEHETRQKKRFRRFSLALGSALLLALFAAGYAFWQQAVAHARELVQASIASESDYPELAVLFAAQAVRSTWPFGHNVLLEAEQQLHNAIALSYERLTLRGHTDKINSVAWSPDGKRLATGSDDKTAKVWDVASGREVLTLTSHHANYGWVKSVAWSPDGKRLATAGLDDVAKVWDATTGKELLALDHDNNLVDSVAWSPDGKRLCTVDQDHVARVWDANTGKKLLALKSTSSTTGLSFFSRIMGMSPGVSVVAWSPDGKRIAGAGASETSVWAADTGKEIGHFGGHKGVQCIAWSPDGKRLAIAGSVLDASTGVTLLNGEFGGCVSWSPDGRWLAADSGSKKAKIWSADTGQEMRSLAGHSFVESVAWSPDGERLATAGYDKTASVWQPWSGDELLELRGQQSAVWSPDGKLLATAGIDSTAKVWEAKSGHELLTLRGHSGELEKVAWSPDGKRLATAGMDRTVRVWDSATGRELLRKNHCNANIVVWRHDGTQIATGEADAVKLWDSSSGTELMTLNGPDGPADVAWSQDDKLAITGRNNEITKVYNAATGRDLATVEGFGCVAWSPDGKRLAAGGASKDAKVWDSITGEQLTLSGEFYAPMGLAWSLAWSPDGKRLAIGYSDATLKIWNARTGQAGLTMWTGYHSLAWSPDGKRLATAHDSGPVRVHAIDIQELMALASERITTSPSAESCKKYLSVDKYKCPPFPTLPWW